VKLTKITLRLTGRSTVSGCDLAWFRSLSSQHLCIFGVNGAICIKKSHCDSLVGNVDAKLEHLGLELVSVVAQRTLEVMFAGVRRLTLAEHQHYHYLVTRSFIGFNAHSQSIHPVPSSLYQKCNSPLITGHCQCTNFMLFDVAL